MRKLCSIFFLSGASALIFEMVWFHLTGLVFGNSVWASTVVLASFMGGLALGNGLAAWRGGSLRSPIRVYAGLELAIAVPGFLLVLLLPRLTTWLVPLWRPLLDQPLVLNATRSALAFLLLLIPATAMGATLPVLVKALSREDANFGRVLGVLYGWNTLGAVAGVLVGEMLLVRWLGLTGSGLAAAALNLTAAGMALWLSSRTEGSDATLAPGAPAVPPRISGRAWPILLVAFVSGAALLGLEVLWFRFVVLFFNGHSWNFAVMLATVLLGISLGGLLAARWYRSRPRADAALVPLLAANGAMVVVLYAALAGVLPVFERLVGYDARIVLVSLFLMLPVSVGSGIVFTMLGRVLHGCLENESRATGLLTLANTTGGMLGAVAAGLVLIPRLGLERSFFAVALTYGLAALLLWFAVSRPAVVTDRRWAWGALGGLALALVLFPFGRMLDTYLAIKADKFRGERRVTVREGLTETAQYLRRDLLGEPYYFRLITNNYTMADTSPFSKRYTKLFAYWPMAVHPRLEKGLVICFGCGSTARALTESRSIESIDIVDISRDIIEMSAVVYPDPASNPIHDPRVRLHIEDGRFFLLTTDERFDLITGEPPPPAARGVVNLYTEEYFRLMHARLRQGGMVTYWLPVHMLSEGESRSIVKAFCNVFDDCSLWLGGGTNYMLVGLDRPAVPVGAEQFASLWRDPVVGPELVGLGFNSPEQLGSLFIADRARLSEWIDGSRPLVDDFPRRISHKSYEVRLGMGGYMSRFDPSTSRSAFETSPTIARIWPQALRERTGPHFERRQTVNALMGHGLLPAEYLLRSARDPLLQAYLVEASGSNATAQRILDRLGQVPIPESTRELEPFRHMAAAAVRRGDWAEAERILEQANDRLGSELGPGGVYYLTTFRMAFRALDGDLEASRQIGQAYVAAAADADRARRLEQMKGFWELLERF